MGANLQNNVGKNEEKGEKWQLRKKVHTAFGN